MKVSGILSRKWAGPLFLISILCNAITLPYIAYKAYLYFEWSEDMNSRNTSLMSAYESRNKFLQNLNTKTNRIIFLGDSITAAVDWAELFQSSKVVNRGIAGDTTRSLLARLDSTIDSRPAAIFLMIGINDLWQGLPQKETIENIRNILHRIRSKSSQTQLFVQSILPVSEKWFKFAKNKEIQILNQRVKKMVVNSGAIYIDLFSGFIGKDGQLPDRFTLDGVHLTGDAYVLWKSLILNQIGSQLF